MRHIGTWMRRTLSALGLAALVMAPPLAGVWAGGGEVAGYMEFPPRTVYVQHAPFSWPVFVALAVFIVAFLFPFGWRMARGCGATAPRAAEVPGPHAGKGTVLLASGLLLGAVAWVLAWTRFDWFVPWQRHTYLPLWLGFILAVNGWTARRTGTCALLRQPGRFAQLFPVSAAFWWFFEYLNRFAQNWHYEGLGAMGGAEYAVMATLSFSTVLPAVWSVAEALAAWPRVWEGLRQFVRLNLPARTTGALGLLLAAAGLAALPRWPDFLFPLLWLSPLLILTSWQALRGRPTLWLPLRQGDWRRVARFAVAALICGFFWEMWNFGSLAHWVYMVPYVDRFPLFKMPVLGYAGYLPFGLECLAVADGIMSRSPVNDSNPHSEKGSTP